MLRVLAISAVIALSLPFTARAEAAERYIVEEVPGAALAGDARVRWLGFPIYSAKLYTPDGQKFDSDLPFALVLTYDLSIGKGTLISATMGELDRMEGARDDHPQIEAKLDACFRDVDDGDRYTAVTLDPDRIAFFFNDTQTCELEHPGIRDRFMGIWLADNSRSPRLTRQLRGE